MNQRLQTTGYNGGISVNARGGGGAALVAGGGEAGARAWPDSTVATTIHGQQEVLTFNGKFKQKSHTNKTLKSQLNHPSGVCSSSSIIYRGFGAESALLIIIRVFCVCRVHI